MEFKLQFYITSGSSRKQRWGGERWALMWLMVTIPHVHQAMVSISLFHQGMQVVYSMHFQRSVGRSGKRWVVGQMAWVGLMGTIPHVQQVMASMGLIHVNAQLVYSVVYMHFLSSIRRGGKRCVVGQMGMHNTPPSAGNGLNGFNSWECSSSLFHCIHALPEQHQEGWKEMGGGSDGHGWGSWAQYTHVPQVMASMVLIHGK